MKKKITILLLSLSIFSYAQKAAKVAITSKISITDALAEVKKAGVEEKFGSRDYEANTDNGKVTLWQSVGRISPFDFFMQITATNKDGVTTLLFKVPHNPKAIANYIKELKKVTRHLKLPDMMIGEYTDSIE